MTLDAFSRRQRAGERPGTLESAGEGPSALQDAIAAQVPDLLGAEHGPVRAMLGTDWGRVLRAVVSFAEGDLLSLARRDPAAHADWRLVLASYRTFRAVLAYRFAHALLDRPDPRAAVLARRISEAAKVETGVEIHPSAVIGTRFVIDHGFGTVIGATTTIGDDCYLLQAVVLGSTRIATNTPGPRHPTLGDGVEIGSFSRVLGPVRVGDGAVIGAHCLVREDVPAGARVSVLHQYQVVSGVSGVEIFCLENRGSQRFQLRGTGLDHPALHVRACTPDGHSSPGLIVERTLGAIVAELPSGRVWTHLRVVVPGSGSAEIVLPRIRLGRPSPNR